MAEKAALSGKDSFLTCSEDLFEGFIRERLNSSTVNDEEETDTEQPIGDDEAEVIAGEDSSGDSTIGGKDKGKDGESSIDSNPSKVSASNPKTIIVSREKLNMKSFADNKVNGNAPSINVVKQLPTTRVISPKHDNGSTIFGSTQSSSGVFLVKSTEKGGKLNSKEVVLNNGKKVVVVSPKNLLVNGDGRSSPEPISTLAINKRIVGNKPVNVIQGADRKSLDVSGISSRLPGLFNGHVSKKMEVSVGADSRKNDSDDREPTSTLNVRVTALPDTHTFKKPIQLNGKKTIVNRKPIPVDSATHKKLLSMMNSNDERIIYVKKNAIRLKPISEHSVQCVVDASNNNVRELATEKAGSEIQRIIMASEKAGSDIQKIMNYQETDDGVHDAEERLSNSSQQLSPESKQKSEQVATVTSKGAENDFAKELAKMYMKQLTNRAVPVYEPQQPLPYVGNMLGCAECNDKFTQQSSLDFHRARRSVLITYSCTVCDRRLSFFNRCSLLRHLRGHQRKITNIDFSSISIKPIPDNLIKLSNTYGQQKVNSVPAQDTAAKKPSTVTQSNSVSTNANSSVTRNSVSIDSNNGVTKVRKVHIDIVGKKQLSPLSAENNSVRNSPPVGDVPVNNSLSRVVTRNVTKQVSEFKTPSPSRLQTTPPKKENSPKIVTKYHPDRRFKTCPECKVNVGSDKTLQDHLLNTNKPNNPYLRCNDCQLILPTRCSLRMHLRMHIPIKPYRCPECGVEYEIYERFMLHLEYECFHLAKVIRFTCTLCDVAEPSLNKLRVHVLNAHTRRIYKCFHCTMAFLSKKLIIRHQNEIHANVETRWNLFSQCKFCPEKMIPQNKFANHIAKHITDENFKLYMYECYECKKNFLQKKALAEHLLTCASNKKVVANGVSDTKVGGERDFVEVGNEALQSNTVVEVEDEVEVIVPERGASTAVEEDDVCERDPLSLEGFQVEEQPVSEPQLELCVLCKKKRVVIEPGVNVAQQSLCCRDCVRPCGGEADLQQRTMITRRKTKTQTIYRCKLCNFLTVVDYDTILRHLRRLHREVGEKDTKHFIDIEKKNIFHSVRSKTVSTADSIKDKYLKKRKVTGESVQVKQEPMDVDENDYEDDSVTTNERVVKKKSLPKAKMPITSGLDTKFDRGLVMEASQPADSSNLQCCKCSFVGESIQALRDHVAQHRTDRSAMQCLECGECFVVLPSLEKHLAIRHHIHNVEQYIAENPSCAPLPPDDVTDTLECSVCLLAFESKQELDKHTRIHGMAFLQQARTKS